MILVLTLQVCFWEKFTSFCNIFTSFSSYSYSCASQNRFFISFIARCFPVPLCFPMYTVPNPPSIFMRRELGLGTFSYWSLLDEVLFFQRCYLWADKGPSLNSKILLTIHPFFIPFRTIINRVPLFNRSVIRLFLFP